MRLATINIDIWDIFFILQDIKKKLYSNFVTTVDTNLLANRSNQNTCWKEYSDASAKIPCFGPEFLDLNIASCTFKFTEICILNIF